MAVIVSNGATTLTTASGFYRAEAHNLGMFSTTDLVLSSTRTIAVTFANAGSCQGLILALTCSATVANLKSVVVTLQENVATVWTDRATVTLSAATIANSVTTATSDGWIVPFTGGTFPYTVTTAASTWRFQVSQSGAQSSNWSTRTSDATNPFFVTWCNNAVTFASNDVVIAKDVVTINTTATFKGVLGTGDTTRSVCAIACRSTTPTPNNVSQFVWENPAAASYTLTLDGLLVLSTHAGFRVGTAASPITLANKAIITVASATSGTAANTGFSTTEHSQSGNNRGASYFFYGAYPSVRSAILSASAAIGQPNIVTTTSTGWAVNDRLFVGGFTTKGMGESTVFTISSIAGANITLNANLGTTARSAQGRVVNLTGYGVELKHSTTAGTTMFQGYCNNFEMQGLFTQNLVWTQNGPSTLIVEDTANRQAHTITYCAFELNAAVTISSVNCFNNHSASETSWTMSNCNAVSMAPPQLTAIVGTDSAATTISSNNWIRCGPVNSGQLTTGAGWGGTISGNVFEGANSSMIVFSATNATITGNRFWACSSNGAVFPNTIINCTFGTNTYENCVVGIHYQNVAVGCTDTDSIFGQEVANSSADISTLVNAYVNVVVTSPTGNLTIGYSSAILANTLRGSHIRVIDMNNSVGDDRGYLKYGNYQRTGTGLTDTLCRTAGGYAIRLASSNSTNVLNWPNLTSERAIPIGNIQSKTMTVTAWVYINNAAFYAGVHTKPTLSVKYDNTTTATAVAAGTAGAWQQLAVTFTPATTYGQIEVWLSGATDATGTNAYFYVDDLNIAYPAGVAVNLGGLDLWSNATPVWPPIATMPSLGGVWDEATSAHVVAGSFAELLTSRIDAAVSTRLSAASYTAPDNASILAVKAKTDNLPADPASQAAILAATLNANVKKVNDVTITGTGAPGNTWGPA